MSTMALAAPPPTDLLDVLSVALSQDTALFQPRDLARLGTSARALHEGPVRVAWKLLFKMLASLEVSMPSCGGFFSSPGSHVLRWNGENGPLPCFAAPAPRVVERSGGWEQACKLLLRSECAHCGQITGKANPLTLSRICTTCAESVASSFVCSAAKAKECFLLTTKDLKPLVVADLPQILSPTPGKTAPMLLLADAQAAAFAKHGGADGLAAAIAAKKAAALSRYDESQSTDKPMKKRPKIQHMSERPADNPRQAGLTGGLNCLLVGTVTVVRKSRGHCWPKRDKSPFMFYSVVARLKLTKESPNLAFGTLATLIGAQWRELADDDKKPYEKEAAKDKARYEKEKAVYARKWRYAHGEKCDKPGCDASGPPRALASGDVFDPVDENGECANGGMAAYHREEKFASNGAGMSFIEMHADLEHRGSTGGQIDDISDHAARGPPAHIRIPSALAALPELTALLSSASLQHGGISAGGGFDGGRSSRNCLFTFEGGSKIAVDFNSSWGGGIGGGSLSIYGQVVGAAPVCYARYGFGEGSASDQRSDYIEAGPGQFAVLLNALGQRETSAPQLIAMLMTHSFEVLDDEVLRYNLPTCPGRGGGTLYSDQGHLFCPHHAASGEACFGYEDGDDGPYNNDMCHEMPVLAETFNLLLKWLPPPPALPQPRADVTFMEGVKFQMNFDGGAESLAHMTYRE